MFTASEFRRIARDKLRGHWGRSVLVTFIFSLICGMSGIYNLAKNMLICSSPAIITISLPGSRRRIQRQVSLGHL